MALTSRSALLVQVTPNGLGAGNSDHVINRPFIAVDCVVDALVTVGGGTAQLLRQVQGAGPVVALSDAMVCAVAGAVTRPAAVWDTAQNVFAIGDVLRLTMVGAANNCQIVITAAQAPIQGAG